MVLMHLPSTVGKDNGDFAHPHLLLPPGRIFSVPGDCAFQAFFPRNFHLPADCLAQESRVSGVAEDLAWAVSDQRYVFLARSHETKNILGNAQDRAVNPAAHVEDPALHLFEWSVQYEINGFTVVLHKYIVPGCTAISVHGKSLIQEHTSDEPRDRLLQMLPRSVIIKGPHNDGGDVVGLKIRPNEPISSALGAGVRR